MAKCFHYIPKQLFIKRKMWLLTAFFHTIVAFRNNPMTGLVDIFGLDRTKASGFTFIIFIFMHTSGVP